jgi:hypothetical protein
LRHPLLDPRDHPRQDFLARHVPSLAARLGVASLPEVKWHLLGIVGHSITEREQIAALATPQVTRHRTVGGVRTREGPEMPGLAAGLSGTTLGPLRSASRDLRHVALVKHVDVGPSSARVRVDRSRVLALLDAAGERICLMRVCVLSWSQD